jgi:hypothetical protein
VFFRFSGEVETKPRSFRCLNPPLYLSLSGSPVMMLLSSKIKYSLSRVNFLSLADSK